MNNYTLDNVLEDKWGVPPTLTTRRNGQNVEFYENSIALSAFAKTISKIPLEFHQQKGRSKVLRDYHRWGIGRPDGYHIVCSPRFREVLEGLQLPEHRFYDAEITAGRRKHRYFVLHFIHDYLNDTCFESTVFARYNLLNGHAPDALLRPGEITDKTHYHTRCQQLVESMHWLYPQKLVFREGFNLDVWGLRGQIILSERARNAITAAGITGVAMPPLQETEQFADMEIG